MRQYCIGATLLDREDPCRIIGQTSEPLLVPAGKERIGYVPNVVYSCGGMIHQGFLVLPYAMSDLATTLAGRIVGRVRGREHRQAARGVPQAVGGAVAVRGVA